MNALISGQAATAIYFEEGKTFSIHIGSDLRVEREDAEIDLIFADATDVSQFTDLAFQDVKVKLQTAWEQERSLQLIFILLDKDEDRETKIVAAEYLNDNVSNPLIQDFIANYLYAAPLPASTNIIGAIDLCDANRLIEVRQFLNMLHEDQSEIRKKVNAWENLPSSLFDGPDDKRRLYRKAVKAGAFRQFVKDRHNLEIALSNLPADISLLEDSKVGGVLREWANSLREGTSNNRSQDLKGQNFFEQAELAGRAEFSLLPAYPSAPNNLPYFLTMVIGREKELIRLMYC